MKHRFSAAAFLLFAVLALASRSDASTIVNPPVGTSPGDTYRFIFVTDLTTAQSTDIATYNGVVNANVAASPDLTGLGTTWTALASTALVDVFTNTGLNPLDTTTKFYNVLGELIATGVTTAGTGLYGGVSTAHGAAILTGSGAAYANVVLTGTGLDGATQVPATSFAMGGRAELTTFAWTAQAMFPCCSSIPLYGISAEFSFPGGGSEVPEPGTIGLTALGGAFLFLGRRRKKQKGQACV